MRSTLHAPSADELIIRLRKIEGQVRGLQRMVDEGERCVDVLTQIASVRAALLAVAVGMVDGELRGIATRGSGPSPAVDELLASVALLARQ